MENTITAALVILGRPGEAERIIRLDPVDRSCRIELYDSRTGTKVVGELFEGGFARAYVERTGEETEGPIIKPDVPFGAGVSAAEPLTPRNSAP